VAADCSQSPRRYVSEYTNLHCGRRENLKLYIVNLYGDHTMGNVRRFEILLLEKAWLYHSSSTLKMDVASSSMTMLPVYQTSRLHNPYCSNLHSHRHSNPYSNPPREGHSTLHVLIRNPSKFNKAKLLCTSYASTTEAVQFSEVLVTFYNTVISFAIHSFRL
jgi:hypothetical protein